MKFLFCVLSAVLCALNVGAFPKPKQDVPPQCIDPTFACQDLESAKLCGVVTSCIHDVWATKGAPNDNDEICDLCKEMVKEARDQLLSNMTQEEIKEVFEGSCKLLPVKLVADACIKVVDEIIPQLVEMLASRMDPTTVCTVSGLCIAIEEEVANVNDDLTCEFCEHVLQHIKDLVTTNTTVEEFRTALLNFCNHTGSFSDKCTSFVNEYFDTLFDYIRKLDTKGICTILGLCDKEKCAQMPLVKLIPAVEAKTIVSRIKLQPAVRVASVASKKDMVETNDIFPATLKKEKVKKYKDLECDLCKEVIGKVEDMIKDKKTEDDIRDALEKVCSYLPSSLSTKCATFVDQYTETIITLLLEEMDPDMICALLNVCPAVAFECEACQSALHSLQEQLANPDTQGEIKNVLKRLCDVMPQSFSKNCEAFVDEYGSPLLVLLSQEIDPSTLCYELQMCSNQTKLFEKPVGILPPLKNDECSVCTTVVDYIDTLLEDDDVDKELSKLVENVCTVLPSSIRQSCSAVIETYGPYILQMIGQVADSKDVCQEIGLCSRPAGTSFRRQ